MTSHHVPLAGSRRFHRGGVTILGRADPHEWCEITVKLRRKKPLPEPSITGTPVLTKRQLDEQHGASADDLAKVEQVLTGFGLHVIDKSEARRSIRFGGPVEFMEKAFQLHLFRARHEGRVHRARRGDIMIPAELDGIVVGVFGLDTRRMKRRRPTGRQPGGPGSAHAQTEARPWFFPAELADLYRFPEGDGAGQTIGIIELGGEYRAGDLQQFAQLARLAELPRVDVIQVTANNEPAQERDEETGEVMLDVEVISGICPRATIAMYFSTFTEQGWVEALDAAVHDQAHDLSAISISFGLAEGQDIWTRQAMDAVNESFKAAAVIGVPVCVASGDDGSDDQVGDGLAHVDFPASSPYCLAVGGTIARRASGGLRETTWKEGNGLRADDGGSTGGGVSAVFPRPDWQKVSVQSVNPGAPEGRCVPDVAADAAGGTGYPVVVFGKSMISGGTSAAAPLWAAFIARLNGSLGANRRIGYLTPVLYQANPQTAGRPFGAVACNDIVSGDNITAAAGGYSAAPGYDAVTGWGTPNGQAFVQFWPAAKETAEAVV